MRSLIIEDDRKLQSQLTDILKTHQFAVDTASDGEEGSYLANEVNYDIAVIDLGLPKKSGIDVIKSLRQAGKKYPVLILTARGDWQDKVSGLEAGADDYLVKPFHVEEMLARVRALMRRAGNTATPELVFGPLRLQLTEKQVSLNQQPVELTAFEYNTLEYLALNRGRVISKTELTEHLYDQEFDRDSNVIEVFIGRLRKKIDDGTAQEFIKTIRGQGYRFVAE
ncbi:MAG: response regulator transcription factor [Hahellaceae bacterium]|jgi:two-component system response regulator PhoP|nr:response regulator transcription factor [Hahellaceae bacterium]MCP5210917.1 response regulator transcription factor [Hahellaceae bacterium]